MTNDIHTISHPIIGITTYRKLADQSPPISLYGLMPAYIEAIVAAGGIPVMIPLGLAEDDMRQLFGRVDGLLLPGGGDVAVESYNGRHPEYLYGVDEDRDRVEFFLSRLAIAEKKPLLAICRGHQVLNVALGGTLYEDIAKQASQPLQHDYNGPAYPRHHISHEVIVEPDSLLSACLQAENGQEHGHIGVNSIHHQSIREVAPNLRVSAVAPDGIIEGVEAIDHPFALGVQWHPENLFQNDPAMLNLFKGFTSIAAEVGQSANGVLLTS